MTLLIGLINGKAIYAEETRYIFGFMMCNILITQTDRYDELMNRICAITCEEPQNIMYQIKFNATKSGANTIYLVQ